MLIKQSTNICLVLIMMASCAFAQGEFLRPGESGFGASGAVLFGEDSDAYGLTIGTSPGGYIDLTFSYTTDESGNIQTYCPSLTFYLKKSQPKSLTGVGFTAGFGRTEMKILPQSGAYNFVIFGITLFANFYTTPTIAVQPSITGGATVPIEDVSDGSSTSITPALTLILGHQSKFRPFFGVGYTTGDDTAGSFFSIDAGFVAAW
ncbi:MAG: hypothetical protein JSV52_11630 [Candidatus Zixiibacteriota bacterium]|nr:MAG: hypothetical protein JSV52_11630 [candidate division Zixibacteria bacterium]